MNLIQLWVANQSTNPISRVQVVAKEKDSANGNGAAQVMSFPEIPVLFPGSTPAMAQIHVDFRGHLEKIPLQVITSEETFEVELAPTAGELLVAQSMNVEEFAQRLSMADGSMLHTSDVTLRVPVQMSSVTSAVLRDCNVAQVYEINSVNAVAGKCKFAGRVRGAGAGGMPEMVLIALEVQMQSGRARVLVVARDVALAQRITASIKRHLPGRDA